ncbi:hypothetical protein [Pseudomonas putida]|uniref:Uncharacterized protein n=1 Tax=Pseudomonas putida TaxID=303 RepID=A0A8I1EHE5_PSEPU|nr:hypothetical protein [Pseudomonas putida]MBI6885785.1 hypothetical protein [Pseudomonas putida]
MPLEKLTYTPRRPKITESADIARMITIVNELGYRVPGYQLEDLWLDVSEENCCNWMDLPKSDDDLRLILRAGLGLAVRSELNHDGYTFPEWWLKNCER